MSLAKALLVVPLVAAIAYAALVALMYFSQRALLYPGAVFAPDDVPAEAAWGQSVTIRTPDGEHLHALYSPASGRPAILLFLGNADRAANYRFLAEALAERRVGLLALSYRGYPGSTGAPTEAGLFADGLAAFDWLAERSRDGIVVLGQSLGSGVAVNTAARRPAVGAVLISPYTSVEALAAASYPWLPVRLLLKDRLRSDLLIRQVRQPKLFIHGRRDSIIPLPFGEELFQLAPEPKRMLVYDAYGHNDIWSDRLVADVLEFIESID